MAPLEKDRELFVLNPQNKIESICSCTGTLDDLADCRNRIDALRKLSSEVSNIGIILNEKSACCTAGIQALSHAISSHSRGGQNKGHQEILVGSLSYLGKKEEKDIDIE